MKNINKLLLSVGLGMSMFLSIGLSAGANNSNNNTDHRPNIAYTSQITNLYNQSGQEKTMHLGQNSKVLIIDDKTNPNLVKVQYGNHEGYIYTDKLSTTNQNEIPMYVSRKTSLYSKPNVHSKNLRTLNENSIINFQGRKKKWMHVKVNDQSAYVQSRYIDQLLR